MSPTEKELVENGQDFLYPNYRQPPIALVRGRGAELWDASGRRYLDLYAGIAVSILGHAHPRLVRAISEQAERLLHVSNYYYNEPNVSLARRVCRLTGMDRAFFCNSGAEAVEAMLKLARRHFFAKGQVDRHRVIAFDNSFHGRTLGALAVTGQAKYRDGFGPLSVVTHVPFGDTSSVRAAMGDDVAAVLVEPIQGEGGVVVAPPGFLAELRALCDGSGALLLFDEVQTGVGRTGRFLACQHDGVLPDALALAKALGGGVPIGAMLCREAFADALPPGSHGSTFGGNPLASAAAMAVLSALDDEGLVQAASQLGEHLGAGLAELAARYPKQVECERGRGLLRALILRPGTDARAMLEELREAGVLLTAAGGRGIRFSPPLVITRAQIDEGLAAVDEVLRARS